MLCARAAQTQLLLFGSDPQNVQARELGGTFGRGCAAPVPGPSSPLQACDALTVAQAHRNQERIKVEDGFHEAKTYIYVCGFGWGGVSQCVDLKHLREKKGG